MREGGLKIRTPFKFENVSGTTID